MTDTPIYDQVQRELHERAEPERAGSRADGAGVSVWALIGEHREHHGQPREGRRRRP
ncbi:hypothetical protein ACTG9Q_16720 [Actinokineospora sp. 24-640]